MRNLNYLMKNLTKLKQQWENNILKKILERFPQRKEVFKSDSDIEIDALYIPPGEYDYNGSLGFPGQFPFTRGVQPSMYRSKLWTMRQYAGFGTAEETNKRFKYLLNRGTTGLSVAFDLPTQIGYDSDHLLAQGEVGKVGVPISSLEDMAILFDGIPLEKVSTSMTINSTAAILLALYLAIAKRQKADLKKLAGTIQNDILKEYIARGTYIFPPDASMRIITDIFEYCHINLPCWNSISISGYHIREAGSNAVQEVAFTMANAITYVQVAIDRGLKVDDFAPRLSFFFNANNNIFEEIAKFRAARRMWAKIMKHRFKATNENSMRMRFHCQTAGSSLTAQQPENNIVRVTLQALAAVLGGTQSLHTNSFDEALALPSEESVAIALRTQQIIAHESGVADTIDPMAGSYYIEFLTDEIEHRAFEYIKKIDALGGAVTAIKRGYFQDEIARNAYEYQKQIEDREKIVVGVNKYTTSQEQVKNILVIDDNMIEKQIQRIKKLKDTRDNERISNTLQKLEKAAQGRDNLMPYIIDCVEAYATLGEISDCLRDVFGTYEETRYS
jgi:methylmalonyl-CoA mutase N-terminal domain/subunit